MFTKFVWAVLFAFILPAWPLPAQTTWSINNTTNIGGLNTLNHGSPQVIATPYGNAVLFNGINQGIVVPTNPIAGATNFTVEMIFRPDASTVSSSTQPRIFHIQSPNPPDHRLTLEARVGSATWYADTFLRTSATANLTLADSSKTHPVAVWHQLAVTYDGAQFRQYVNGTLELSGALMVTPLTNGLCSIGMRANTNNFFQGAVLALRFTPRVLSTNEFMCIPKTLLSALRLSNGQAQLDFTLTAGLPIGFTLQQADAPGGTWSVNSNAVLATNSEGVSYRFTAPAGNSNRFFRLRWP